MTKQPRENQKQKKKQTVSRLHGFELSDFGFLGKMCKKKGVLHAILCLKLVLPK